MKSILFILSMMISTAAFSRAEEELKVRDIRMERQNENLAVSFTVEVPKHAVRSRYKQFLVPVVYNKDKMTPLPGMELMGRNKARREKQVRLLTHTAENAPGGIIAREEETIAYSATIPYQQWMDTLSLRVERTEEGCCKEKTLAALSLAEGINLSPKQAPVPVVTPPAAPIAKEVSAEQLFTVYFRFNEAEVDAGFSGNASILADVANLLKQGTKMKIEISGYASPEGNKAWNEKLAYRRAEALKEYLIGHGWTRQDAIAVVHHAINWEGLKALAAESDVPFKADVLEILNDTNNVELTNRKLQQLQKGVPYHYLVTKVYPKLRVASFLITNF